MANERTRSNPRYLTPFQPDMCRESIALLTLCLIKLPNELSQSLPVFCLDPLAQAFEKLDTTWPLVTSEKDFRSWRFR